MKIRTIIYRCTIDVCGSTYYLLFIYFPMPTNHTTWTYVSFSFPCVSSLGTGTPCLHKNRLHHSWNSEDISSSKCYCCWWTPHNKKQAVLLVLVGIFDSGQLCVCRTSHRQGSRCCVQRRIGNWFHVFVHRSAVL